MICFLLYSWLWFTNGYDGFRWVSASGCRVCMRMSFRENCVAMMGFGKDIEKKNKASGV